MKWYIQIIIVKTFVEEYGKDLVEGRCSSIGDDPKKDEINRSPIQQMITDFETEKYLPELKVVKSTKSDKGGKIS